MFFALSGLIIVLWSQSSLNTAISTQEKIIESVNTLNITLNEKVTNTTLTQVENIKIEHLNLQNSLNAIKSYQTAGLAIIVIGIICVFVSLLVTFSTDKQVKIAIRNSFDSGKVRGNVEAMMALDKDPSVLLSMLDWLYLFQKGKGNLETANHILNQFFRRAQDTVGLKPFGLVGDVLQFDHQKHTNQSVGVKPGDKVKVIETGWKIGNTILRKPKVERE